MQDYFSAPFEMFSAAASLICKSIQTAPKLSRAAFAQAKAAQYYWNGVLKYTSAFMTPSINALSAFAGTEREKLAANAPADNLQDYSKLFNLNVKLAGAAMAGSVKAMNSFFYDTLGKGITAWMNTLENEDSYCDFACRLEKVLKVTVDEYPKAVEAIGREYGFHVDNGGYVKVAETEHFNLYQVLPNQKGVTPRRKPIMIVPPYVLGGNILAFLPGEQRSYVHFYANQGIPTYIRLIKDIRTNVAVQDMTGEDDALDTRFFCQELMKRHNRPVTLNGFCQGGLLTLSALLSGELDGLVDAMITCVTPVDGSRSRSLMDFINGIPDRFTDLRYSEKTLPNGNTVIDGPILSWVYKLRKLDAESPIASFHRDIDMFNSQAAPQPKIGKTAAAVSRWLIYDQTDVPVNITKMSFASYTIPIDAEGNLPITLFGRKLNLKRIEEKKIPWLVCIAEGDDLVDKESSLAALDYIGAEVCIFPKGHASIATSWSIPTSQCALHLHFHPPGVPATQYCKTCRGPVCFQIDLDAAIEAAEQKLAAPEASVSDADAIEQNPDELSHSPDIEAGAATGPESQAPPSDPPTPSTKKPVKKAKAGGAALARRTSKKTTAPKTR